MAKKVRRRLTVSVFKKACEGSRGNISLIARKLGVDRWTVYRFMEKHPELKKLLEIERDERIFEAESVIDSALEGGSIRAAIYILSTLGKKYGYVKRVETTPVEAPTIIFEEVGENNTGGEDDIRGGDEG